MRICVKCWLNMWELFNRQPNIKNRKSDQANDDNNVLKRAVFPPVPFAFAPNNERISVLFKVVVDARKGFSYTLDDAEDCVYDSYRQMQNIAPSERNRE